MSKTQKEKFDNLDFDNLPDHMVSEFELIQEKTDNFQDEDAVEIFKRNFDYLYYQAEKKYPTGLKDYVPPAPTPEELEAKRLKDEKLEKLKKLASEYSEETQTEKQSNP